MTSGRALPYGRRRLRWYEGWGEAVRLYLHDPRSNRFLRILAVKVAPVVFAGTILDDAAGFLPDDASWPVFIVVFLVALFQIRKYRKIGPANHYGTP